MAKHYESRVALLDDLKAKIDATERIRGKTGERFLLSEA